MKEEVKKLWVEALLSGKYEQGKHHLAGIINEKIYHCCLGVLCEVAQENGLEIKIDYDKSIIRYDNATKTLPDSVNKWAGVSTPGGRYNDGDFNEALAEQNDNGKTFKEIADIIEKNWEKL